MKKKYLDPEIELIRFAAVDVITTSTTEDLEEDELPGVNVP